MPKNDEALALMREINKDYGEGAVMIASDMFIPRRFTTGSLSLDVALGGGFPGNQWVEIYGPENHGKTAIALKTIAANQQADPDFYTLWVASEAYELDQAKALGVDTDRVLVLNTRDMAFAYQKICDFLEKRAVDCVVLDSYPALVAPDEDVKEMDTDKDPQMSEGAKLTNRFFRKVGKAGLRDATDPEDRPFVGIFINQPRDAPGKWAPHGQTAETTSGGRGKNFSFYVRLEVKRTEFITHNGKRDGTKVGQVIHCTAIKNKGGPPMRVASLDFYFTDSGQFKRGDYDSVKDVLTIAVLFDVIRKSSSWYKFEDYQWQGLKACYAEVKDDPALLKRIEEATREAAARPDDKRTWDSDDVESAQADEEPRPVRRRRRVTSDQAD